MRGSKGEVVRVSVLVVRVERNPYQLLITVSSTPDIEKDEMLRQTFQQPDAALLVVEDFIRRFSD